MTQFCGWPDMGTPFMPYYNSCLPLGNTSQFCVRFGRFVFDPQLRRVDKPEDVARVESGRPVWWNKSLYRQTDGNLEWRVLHLINPPLTTEMETDPQSRLPEPIGDIKVSMRLPGSKTKAQAWLLTSEALELGQPPKTQAVPLKVETEGSWATVTVPQVLYWKMVVWKFE